MSEMIERVARAIYESQEWDFAPHCDFTELSDGSKEVFRLAAGCAIKAMREPNPTMRKAFYEDNYGDCEAIWQTMIDAALPAVEK